jgi:hypothetical protein
MVFMSSSTQFQRGNYSSCFVCVAGAFSPFLQTDELVNIGIFVPMLHAEDSSSQTITRVIGACVIAIVALVGYEHLKKVRGAEHFYAAAPSTFNPTAAPYSSSASTVQPLMGTTDPSVAVNATGEDQDAIVRFAVARASTLPKPPCDFLDLVNTVQLDTETGSWRFVVNTWCDGRVRVPVDGAELRRTLQGKKILFLGDSVARNSFVMTMARLCNENNMFRCLTRMPTYEYDVVNPTWRRGPMGCVPNAASPDDKSPCYANGTFRDVPLRGLTLNKVPQDRNMRRNFIRKGLIGPLMTMRYGDIVLTYLPINKPQQLTRTGMYLARNPRSVLHADVIVVSIGPHLSLPEIKLTPLTLISGLARLRAATSAPILQAEFTHALGQPQSFVDYIDQLMGALRKKMEPLAVYQVPQRFATRHGFRLFTGNASESELQQGQKGCGFYDNQHPALHCQFVTSNMLLASAIVMLRAK